MVLAIGGVLAVFAAISYFSRDAQTRRALRDTPSTSIHKVQDGAVARVKGRVRPIHDLIEAPLSGRLCSYYVAIVEERRKSGKSSYWAEVARDARGVDFAVEDVTGEILVRAAGLEVAITLDKHTRSGTFDDATEAEQKFLASMNVESTGLLGFNRTLRYTEGVLEPGEEITVLGLASPCERPGGGRALRLGPRPDGPALASDDRDVVLGR